VIKLFSAVAVLLLLSCAACTDSDAPQASSSSATASSPVARPSCIVAEPPDWSAAVTAGKIDTGGVSTTARAVTPDGEVLAVRDNGDSRDLILIGADRSVRELYAVPDPDTFDIGYAGVDDRWIVFALVRAPRNANGVLPTIKRIEIMDRADGSIRTIAAQSPADQAVIPERNALDSVALHDGTVYWMTLDDYASDDGTVRSFDPVTGAIVDVESGPMRDLTADAGGVSWAPPGPGLPAVRIPADLPEALAEVDAADRVSVGSDGAAYGWIIGLRHGGTGVGYWSRDTGVVTVTGLDLKTVHGSPTTLVYGPFVILDKGLGGDTDTSGIVVDTRTGAVTGLEHRPGAQYDRVVDARDGVLAIDVWSGPGKGDTAVGVLDAGAWAPLRC